MTDLHELYPDETELTCFYAELLIETDQEEKRSACSKRFRKQTRRTRSACFNG
ncbi:hypothetical protein PO124_15980 [Bacillus licheniformis]|nr:hypothetical protein [Bacillus licheniformis]